MLWFVLSVLVPNVFMCGMRQHLWANLHKTNMAADEICVPCREVKIVCVSETGV